MKMEDTIGRNADASTEQEANHESNDSCILNPRLVILDIARVMILLSILWSTDLVFLFLHSIGSPQFSQIR